MNDFRLDYRKPEKAELIKSLFLRDLALKVKQPIIPITRSIRPYVTKKLLSFTEIPDIVEDAHQGFHVELLEAHPTSSGGLGISTTQTASERVGKESETIENNEILLGSESKPIVISEDPATAVDSPQDDSSLESVSATLKGTQPEHKQPEHKQLAVTESETNATDSDEQQSESLISKKKTLEAEAIVELSTLEASTLESTPITTDLSKHKDQNKDKDKDKSSEHSDDERAVAHKNTASASLRVESENVISSDATSSDAEDTHSKVLSKDPEQSALSSPDCSTQDGTTLDPLRKENKESQPGAGVDQGGKQRRRRKKNRQSRLPKVVYVDDSPADSRIMAGIVENMGYQYINIRDPLHALPMLIELKPKLIFLDLVMPIANGYEICAQIRRVSSFKKTPIVIVTSNDGIADRVRAKIVGASGFMGKPIKEKKVIKVFKKHFSYVEPTKR